MIELNAKKLSAAQIVPTVKLRLRSTPRSSSGGSGVVRCAVSDSSTDCRTATVYAFARRTCRTTNHDAAQSDKHRAPHHRIRRRVRFDVCEPEHQAAEAEHRHGHREEIGLGMVVGRPEVTQPEDGQQQAEHTDHREREEKIERQPKLSVWKPPKVGPSAGARSCHADRAHGHATAG